MQNGYENIDFISDISLEDLQEIGITKLGKTAEKGTKTYLNETKTVESTDVRCKRGFFLFQAIRRS